MISKILVAVDASESSLCAAEYVAYLAKNLGCTVKLVHTLEYPAFFIRAGITTEEEKHEFVEGDERLAGRSFVSVRSQWPMRALRRR